MADTHIFDLLRREQTELDLLDGAQRRIRVRKDKIRHDEDGRSSPSQVVQVAKEGAGRGRPDAYLEGIAESARKSKLPLQTRRIKSLEGEKECRRRDGADGNLGQMAC